MNHLQQVQLATQTYLGFAYTDQIPENIEDKAKALQRLETWAALCAWDGLEHKGHRFTIRLGNDRYPHMKLVFVQDSGMLLFYVDAHDAHFTLPERALGYEDWRETREANLAIKLAVEEAWAKLDLPIFGQQPIVVTCKKVCQNMRVLAVDDEVQILEMLGLIVTSMGADYQKARSAAEARDRLSPNTPPDLVFCDIMMPGESGCEFAEWLKKHYPEVPIHFITGLGKEKIEQIRSAKVLQKPFSAKSVMQIMKSVYKTRTPNPAGLK